MKRTITDLTGLKGKVVLLRVDFNVPMDENGKIVDFTRIMAELPTIKYLSQQGARIVLLSHLGRPNGYEIKKSLWPIALFLMKKLKCNVDFCNKVIGQEVKERIAVLKEGNVLLLENVRFYEEETNNDKNFAREIASYGDLYINDAFATAHRENVTTYGLATILPNATGFLMERELKELSKLLSNPERPFVAVVGGAKVKDKLPVLSALVDKADTLIIGGAMAYTFLKAKGENIGLSICDQDSIAKAREILNKAYEQNKKILLPVDHVCMRKKDKSNDIYHVRKLMGDMVGYDVGAETCKIFAREIKKAKTVFWNGPVGKFEEEDFAEGTISIAKAVASCKGHTIVGGGDTASVINKLYIAHKIDYISTGGGATLEFIEKGSLPCVDVLQERSI